jgi:hypothetical protein
MPERFQSDIIEPEEQREAIYNPLDEAVNEKSYAIPSMNTEGLNMNAPIEEPMFTPPPIQKAEPVNAGGKPPKPEPFNPEMKNLSKKDTEMASEHMAKLILQGYEFMHTMGNKFVQVSEKKLNKMQSEGEINLNAMIDYDYGKKIRAGEFFQEYNNQVKDLLTVSQEFKDEVTPILTRVLAKRGIAMTDEQLLVALFAKDAIAKVYLIIQQKQVTNQMLATIKEVTTSQYAQAAPTPPHPPQPIVEEPTIVKEEPIIMEPEEIEMDSKVTITDTPKRKRGRPKG